jgi:hypothetical protein
MDATRTPDSRGSSRARDRRRAIGAVVVGCCLAVLAWTTVDGQPLTRRATNIAALQTFPSFYHLRPILLVGTVGQQPNGAFRITDATGSLQVIPTGSAPDGINEVRGVFWDLGRLKSDDARLANYDLRATFGVDPDGAWPRPGEVTAVIEAAITPAPPAPALSGSAEFPAVSIRSIVLDAARYVGEKVTVTGQYYGRNLTGDLPDAPRQSRYDFVLRSADAPIWVSSLRPRGRDADGRNFELGLDARIDTGKWLRVSGIVRQGRGLLWIEGEEGTLALADPEPVEDAIEEAPVRVPLAPPPQVVFSAPTEGEIDVSLTTNVRIQFSRDVNPSTFKGRIRATYADAGPAESGSALTFETEYRAFNRVLELTFPQPFERFRTLRVELLEGILGTDEQPLKPWTLTVQLGGS